MLPESARAKLAHSLVTSLNAPVDAKATEEWDKEILRRLAEVDSGTAKYIDRDEFQKHMHMRLNNR